MNEEDKKLNIATFRFGLISEFVTGVRLNYGEKERLIKEKVNRIYDIPYSTRSHVARSTLEKWIVDYKKAGFKIEGLYPQSRNDKGQVRSLSTSVKLAIKELKKETPNLNVPAIIKQLKHKKLISVDEELNLATIYRYLRSEELVAVNESAKDKRQFEASHPNEIWQSDVMHGPLVKFEGKERYIVESPDIFNLIRSI